jgi:hypothetical protein
MKKSLKFLLMKELVIKKVKILTSGWTRMRGKSARAPVSLAVMSPKNMEAL